MKFIMSKFGDPDKKSCPIFMLDLDMEDIDCHEQYCAWWDKYNSCCAILSIAKYYTYTINKEK